MNKNSPLHDWRRLSLAFLFLVSACGPKSYSTFGNGCDGDSGFCPSKNSQRATALPKRLLYVTPPPRSFQEPLTKETRKQEEIRMAPHEKQTRVAENRAQETLIEETLVKGPLVKETLVEEARLKGKDLRKPNRDENAFWFSEEKTEQSETQYVMIEETPGQTQASRDTAIFAPPLRPSGKVSAQQALALRASGRTPSPHMPTKVLASAQAPLSSEDIAKAFKVTSLKEALLSALSQHPRIIIATSRLRAAKNHVKTAEAVRKPQIKARIGFGYQFTGNYGGDPGTNYFSSDKDSSIIRTESSLSSKNLLYDFGASFQNIANKKEKMASEYFKLQEEIIVVSEKVFEIYLSLKSKKETLKAFGKNIARLRELRNLLKKNQENGNATKADLDRLQSRLLSAQTNKSDILNDFQEAKDQFVEIVHQTPGDLSEPPDLSAVIPRDFKTAKKQNSKSNPRLLALQKDVEAAKYEVTTLKRGTYPTLRFENTLQLNDTRSKVDRTDLEAKSLLTLNYNLYDGGAAKNKIANANEQLIQKKFGLISEKKSENAFLRKSYRSIRNTSLKKTSIEENLSFARTARDLYYKQYKAGEKSLLELIDVEENYFQASLRYIQNKYDKVRSVYKAASMLGLSLPHIFQKPRRVGMRASVPRRRQRRHAAYRPHPVPRPQQRAL